MTLPEINITNVSQAIQLALTPVFLLTGIGGLLNVMTGRLARIIDRGRYLAETPPPTLAGSARLEREFHDLEKRRRLASGAITACTFAALTTCLVIVLLFLEVMGSLRIMWLVGLTFMLSTLALVISLALFLREVHLATYTVRIAQHSGQTRF
jgi:hypothetical protein